MPRLLSAAVLGFILLQPGLARAVGCSPHCDYVHFYGPYDFSYVRPGLSGYPICNRQGDCSPRLIYRYSHVPWRGITIVVRPRHRPR